MQNIDLQGINISAASPSLIAVDMYLFVLIFSTCLWLVSMFKYIKSEPRQLHQVSSTELPSQYSYSFGAIQTVLCLY